MTSMRRRDAAAVAATIALVAWAVAQSSPAALTRLWEALLLTTVFAGGAWVLHAVSTSGALAGAGVAFIFYLRGGWRLFTALFLVFVLTWAATRLGYERKQSLGAAETKRGRSAVQVMANLTIATVSLVLGNQPAFAPFAVGLCVAALTEAAADTVSSEIGLAFGRTTYLFTSLKPIASGTDGGVSIVGTSAGMLAALLVPVVCVWLHLITGRYLGAYAVAGVAGMFVDSLLGATLERKRRLNNDAVNLLSTLAASVTAWLLIRSL